MAWRPTQYLLEGELDNTTPGKVTGWMQFVGMDNRVAFDLRGDFHRDIRGAKIRFKRDPGRTNDERQVRQYMDGFAEQQTGDVGNITAGREPRDCGLEYPYVEWYGDLNGRVVIELDPAQVEVIGEPIPACESDPVSPDRQQLNMARFLGAVSQALGAPAITVGCLPGVMSDPRFTHWVVESGRIVGEANSVKKIDEQMSMAFVRLYSMPAMAERGHIQSNLLMAKGF